MQSRVLRGDHPGEGIQWHGYLYVTPKRQTQRRRPCADTSRYWNDVAVSQGTPGVFRQKLGEARKDSPLELAEGTQSHQQLGSRTARSDSGGT